MVFAFGNMQDGALGDGKPIDDEGTNFPARYLAIGIPPENGPMSGKEISQIDAGKATTYFLSREGQVFATGWNFYQQLGAGYSSNQSSVTPIMIPPPNTDMYGKVIKQVSAGQVHALFLDVDGRAYVTGDNSHGQAILNYPLHHTLSVPEYIHTVYAIDPNDPSLADDISPNPIIASVAAGYYTTFLIEKGTGEVFAGGSQLEGAAGLGPSITHDSFLGVQLSSVASLVGVNVTKISGGAHHTLFLDNRGQVWCVGFGGFGQLGTGMLETLYTPALITHNLGDDHPLSGVRIKVIATGAYHSVFATEEGQVFVVGSNESGQMGVGYVSAFFSFPHPLSLETPDLYNRTVVDAACGEDFSVLKTDNGELYFVGGNRYGQNGFRKEDPIVSSVVGTWTFVSGFAVGSSFAFVIDNIICPPGNTLRDIYTLDCESCPDGRYCPTEYIFYTPKLCDDYTWSRQNSSAKSNCTKEQCGKGYVCKDGLKKECPPGQWSELSIPNQCSQQFCGRGYICQNGKKDPCPPGQWSEPGDVACGPCPPRMVCAEGEISGASIFSFLEAQIVGGALIMGLCFCCFFIITLSIVSWVVLRGFRQRAESSDKRVKLLEDYLKPEDEEDANRARLLIKNSLLEIDYAEISISRKLGSGGSGSVVLLGDWKGIQVAVKVFKVTNLSGEKTYDAYERELSVMIGLRHPSLVVLLGCCLNYPRLALVMEYCSQGSLAECISSGRFRNFSIATIYSIVRDICEAAHYLHSREVLHRDIKCDNIFLTANNRGKLADFGLSRVQEKLDEESLATNSVVGSFYYCAPEVTNQQPYDYKADVFSFGIVLYEMFTNKLGPYEDCTPLQAQFRTAENPNFRPDITKIESGPFGEKAWILEECWSANPDERPDFKQLREHFRHGDLRESTDLLDQMMVGTTLEKEMDSYF